MYSTHLFLYCMYFAYSFVLGIRIYSDVCAICIVYYVCMNIDYAGDVTY